MNHRMPRLENGEIHPDPAVVFADRHDVRLVPGGAFARLLGCETIRVNSLHGQGILEPGERVVVEGVAEDGTIEAIRIADAPGFALGVQWHAEYDAAAQPGEPRAVPGVRRGACGAQARCVGGPQRTATARGGAVAIRRRVGGCSSVGGAWRGTRRMPKQACPASPTVTPSRPRPFRAANSRCRCVQRSNPTPRRSRRQSYRSGVGVSQYGLRVAARSCRLTAQRPAVVPMAQC